MGVTPLAAQKCFQLLLVPPAKAAVALLRPHQAQVVQLCHMVGLPLALGGFQLLLVPPGLGVIFFCCRCILASQGASHAASPYFSCGISQL